MRKTNKNIRRAKLIKQMIIKFALTQISVFLIFAGLFYESKPYKRSDSVNVTIIVEEKEYYTRLYSERYFRVFSDEVRYDFPNLGITGEFTSYELYQEIQTGESLNVSYVTKYGLLGKYKLVLDARSNESIYLDFDFYNTQKEKAFTAVKILFIVVELIVLFIFVLIALFNKKELELFHRRKKRL